MSDGRTDDERPASGLRHRKKGSRPRATLEEIYADAELIRTARALQCFTVTRVARLMDCTSFWVREMLAAGKLKGFYLGSSVRIPAWSVWEFQGERIDRYRVERIANVEKVNRWRDVEKTKRTPCDVPASLKAQQGISPTENPSNNPPKNN